MLANVFTKTVRDRWKGEAIAAVTMAAMLLFGMAVYKDIDLSVYTDLPAGLRALAGISETADAASLAYAAIYGSYGALVIAGLAIFMGSGSIAGEEQKGTLGLLLGNPKSRTTVLVSKAETMVLLTKANTLLLWGTGVVVPDLLNVDVTGMMVGPFMFHMFVNAIFYGFLALAVGAWSGSSKMAGGVATAVMVLSFFAVGLLPLVEGWENATKAFPWYYYNTSTPVINGVDWGHMAVLLGGIVLFAVAALVGVNRRDLKNKPAGASLVDQLRNNPATEKAMDRLAGGTRVSKIWVKTASEHQGLLVVTASLMFFMMGLLIGPTYTLIDDALKNAADQFPEVLLAFFGGGDMGTPEGFYQVETFGMMAPIAVMVATVAIGARAVAGEEANNTMGLLLANPVKRSTVVLQKTIAMVIYGFVVGIATFAGVAGGSLLGGLGMDMGNIAAASLLVTLLGLAFGAFSLALGAGTGKTRVAVYGTVGAALAFHIVNAFAPYSDNLSFLAKWSPFYYYLGSDPLNSGMHWGHAAVLTGLTLVLIGLAVVLFQRRDLRQTG